MEVGAGVFSVAPGDHVVFGFVPACGRCPSCASGHSNLCDMNNITATGMQLSDGTSRHHDANGDDLTLAIGALGTFAHHTVVNEASCIKIDKELPLERACLLGCGVVTGWGSAVYAAEVGAGRHGRRRRLRRHRLERHPGRQARRRHASSSPIDPVEFKREKAMEFGATHTFASVAEATEALGEVTWDRGYDKVIMTIGVGNGDVLGEAFWLGGKRCQDRRHQHPPGAGGVDRHPGRVPDDLIEKQLIGSLFGSANPRKDIPKLLELYTQGLLDLDGLVTKEYPLEQINEGYDDMNDGKNIRGVLVYE